MRRLLLIPLFLCTCAVAQTSDAPNAVRVIAGVVPYYCNVDADQRPSGLACEILVEMQRRVGHSSKIEFYPHPRALMIGASEPNVLVVPVARIPQREKLYGWEIPILEDEFVVVTRRSSDVDISSLEKLRQLSIGIVRFSALDHFSTEFGWHRPSVVANEETNARKLAAGRIDAWAGSWNGIRASQRLIGLDERDLRRGVVLKRVKIYVASSYAGNNMQIMPWKRAFEAMRKDGSYDALLRKYRHELPR